MVAAPHNLQGKKFSITEALPDSPICNRGFVIGGMRTKDSSKNTQEKNSKSEKKIPNSYSQNPGSLEKEIKDWGKKGIYEAAKHQMSAEPDLSTGAKKKD
jgi:hypothetical protein